MKFLVVFTVLNLVLFSFPFTKADNKAALEVPEQSEQPIGLPKRSIWRIHNDLQIQETGFFIEEDLFVTSFNVIQSQKASDNASDEEFVENLKLSQSGNLSIIKVEEVLAVSALHNLALLRTEKVQYHLSLRQNPLESSKPLTIPTYSGGFFTEIKKRGDILFENGSFYIFPIRHPALHGANGSPVLDNKRRVAGVLFSGFMSMAYTVTPNQLKAFLEGNTGLNCSDFANAESCIERETENLKSAAEKGDPAAQFNWGRMHDYILASERELKLAFHWYEKAAQQGFVPAEYKIALMYANGLGVEINGTLALEWLDKVTEQVKERKDLKFSTCYNQFSEQ